VRTPHLFLLLLPCCAGCQPVAAPHATPPPHLPGAHMERPVSLATLLDSLGIEPHGTRLVVLKSRRTFHVLAGDDTLKTYPCVLGEKPVGDKHMQGDRRTPEGEYTFRDKYPHRQWHKFAWIDYPNAESWRRFRERQRAGTVPTTAAIGGEIGIHGVPDGMDHWITQGMDWTWGCIALRNADLDEVWPCIVPKRTPLWILP
jgi:murein L,D-transpeptidase YafK